MWPRNWFYALNKCKKVAHILHSIYLQHSGSELFLFHQKFWKVFSGPVKLRYNHYMFNLELEANDFPSLFFWSNVWQTECRVNRLLVKQLHGLTEENLLDYPGWQALFNLYHQCINIHFTSDMWMRICNSLPSWFIWFAFNVIFKDISIIRL